MDIYVSTIPSIPDPIILLDVQPDTIYLTIGEFVVMDDPEAVDGATIDSKFAGKYVRMGNKFTCKLDDLRNRQEWKDASTWSFAINKSIYTDCVVNKVAESFSIRRSSGITGRLFDKFFPVDIVIPHKEVASFEDCTLCVYTPDINNVVINKPFLRIYGNQAVKEVKAAALPLLRMSAPETMEADSFTSVELSAIYKDSIAEFSLDVELSNINGYLPKTRVDLKGTTSFKIYSTGLVPGDTVRIKAGFRYLASVDEITIKVV